jgi:hypothetical protein
MMFALTTAPVYGLVASPRAILHPAAALGRHGAQPQMQFGGFKLPDFKLPGDDGNAEKKGEEQAAPAAADDTKPAASNPFEKLVSAFTPVEVDRDGNVVPDAELPTLFGESKKKQTLATTDEEDERAKQRIAAQQAQGDEKDVGEKLFSFFFGDPQEGEVAGLARTGGAPDTYPATKTEFADPVEGDSAEVKLLRPMLKNTNLEYLPLRLAYDAAKHGWKASAWHAKVDRTGPCLVVARTKGGAYCGGYAPKGFAGYGENRGSIAAFLFTWPDGDTSQPVVKLQKIGGAGLATIDMPETGPRFGSDGFVVRLEPGSERNAVTKLGPYYEVMPGGGRSIFAAGEGNKVQGSFATELAELRTYVGVWPEGERIPYDGAIPFAIE